jgi:glyoxylase-like metal-dependent hydrolase (beta-lactamase superfamily II)
VQDKEASMRIHHLNCGTMRPASQRLTNGTGGLLSPGTLVCHCLLIETDHGLVLVDSGFGRHDIEDPTASLGSRFLRLARPVLDNEETAIRQVTRLGYRPTDVRHIVLTHLDPDHAGGIGDFPWATVHLHAQEHTAGTRRLASGERRRYRPNQWAHEPRWATYSETTGERWFGFDAIRQLTGLPPEILLIPLLGHSRGHSAVAVDLGQRWLMHAGDAYFFSGETDPNRPHCPLGLRVSINLAQFDGVARRKNLARLRHLRAVHDNHVEIISAHDPTELVRPEEPTVV